MVPTKTAHQETIPSPLDYVVKTLDSREEERCDYSFEMLTKLVLMAIGARAENVLRLREHRWRRGDNGSAFIWVEPQQGGGGAGL
jgi:hypothetical protein